MSAKNWERQMPEGVYTVQSSVERYQFPSLIKRICPPPGKPGLESARDSPQDQEEHRQRVRQVRLLRIALRQGKERGHKKGYSAGYDAGHGEGFQDGYEKGLEEGFQEAYQEQSEEKDRLLAQMSNIWFELQALQENTMSHLGKPLIDLVTTVVEQVLGHELASSRKSLRQAIEESLGLLPQPDGLVIYCHPEDRPLVEQMADKLPDGWFIEEDEQLTPGGCRLQTTSGEVDATLAQRTAASLVPVNEYLSPS